MNIVERNTNVHYARMLHNMRLTTQVTWAGAPGQPTTRTLVSVDSTGNVEFIITLQQSFPITPLVREVLTHLHARAQQGKLYELR